MKTNYENYDHLWRYLYALRGLADSIGDLPVTNDQTEINRISGLLAAMELPSEKGEALTAEYRDAATDYDEAVSATQENALPECESRQSAEGIAGQPTKGVETDGPTRQ